MPHTLFSRMRLGNKQLLLVAIPILCELLSVTSLFYLLSEARKENASIAHSAELVSQLDALLILNCKRASGIALSKISGSEDALEETASARRQSLKQIKTIDELVSYYPDERVRWQRLKNLGLDTEADLHHATSRYNHGRKEEALIAWARYQTKVQRLYSLQQEFTEGERLLRANRAEWERAYYHQIELVLLLTILFGVVLAFALAIYFNRSMSARMSSLINNARRIAGGGAPNERVDGADELAELHKIYSDMFLSLTALREREQAILSNSAEGICSLDASLRFNDVNEALLDCYTRAGLLDGSHSLVGQRLGSIVSGQSFDQLEQAFEQARKKNDNCRIDIEFECGDNDFIGLSWSIVWSQVQKEFYCIVQDTTEKRRLEKLKADFLAMVSHDLRAPLASIELTHSLLLTEDLEQGTLKSVEIAQASTKRLLALVNNLLDLDKIEDASMEIEPRERLLLPTVEAAVESLAMVALQKKVTVIVDIQSDLMAYFDHDRIVQVLVNLLSNSYKYSKPHTQIRLQAKAEVGCVSVSVSDQGPGIPADRLEAVFEKFRQVSRADHSEHGGTGLGLAICQAIVKKHGGQMRVESDGKTGSVFIFSLPFKSQLS